MKHRNVVRWVISAVLIAGAIVAIRFFDGAPTLERDGLTFASDDLAQALSGKNPTIGVRIVTPFKDGDGAACRAFLAPGVSGIACEEHGGWHLRMIRDGVSLDDPAAIAATEAALQKAAAQMAAQ